MRGSASSTSSQAPAAPATTPAAPSSGPAASPAGLTSAQGAQACHDLAAWWQQQYSQNQDQPRFSATLQADEQQAYGTQLGSDMRTLDQDLQSEHTAALVPGPPGSPNGWQVLQGDCRSYGVTLPG